MTLKATLVAALPEARRISNFLERDYGEAGAVVSLDERPDGLWSVDAYFESGQAEDIEAQIRDGLGADAFGAPLAVNALPDADWVAEGLKTLKPVVAGRFLVHGSHDRPAACAGRIAIEIDAGQAFGTGHHASTAGVLATLDRLINVWRFRRVLDLGTGSGILWLNHSSPFAAIYQAGDATFTFVSDQPAEHAADGGAALVRSRSEAVRTAAHGASVEPGTSATGSAAGHGAGAEPGHDIGVRLERGLGRIVELLAP